ncbi:glycosyltransferase [Paenibacillus cymbidii]|uniref:glycosyltransferase n=1 Tax=Paenibacillus cymbidii TaxID=1639034 RepID=UPI0010802EEB|nr:glycosyltransferase [Paenibacillus cymbidii]
MNRYSVLMSVYIKEQPQYLKQSIDSMLNQTVFPDEIVIVKDGPLTEQLDSVLDGYASAYPSLFKIITNEQQLGLGMSLSTGLNHCKNELVARMDTDDISLPERCEKQLKEFQKNKEISLIGGTISEFIDIETNIIGRRIVPTRDNEIKAYLKKRCPFNHVSVMFKKNEVIKAGSYCDWYCNEDYYLWIRMYEYGSKFANLAETLVYVRVGPDMYKRRGGKRYYKSEKELQKYMYKKKIISYKQYLWNSWIRFIFQVLVPNSIRGYLFKKLARS